MNILRFIALGVFGEKDLNNGALLYFGVAAFFYLLASSFAVAFMECDYFKALEKRD